MKHCFSLLSPRHMLRSCLIAWILFLSACGPSAPSETTETGTDNQAAVGQKETITIALIPKKKGLPYFPSCASGAEAAAQELGNVTLIYDGPTDGSPEKQASMIEQYALKGVDVIAV